VITSAAPTSADENVLYVYEVTANDPEGQSVTFRLSQGPQGMAIDATTGRITWLPDADVVGSHAVTVEARDPTGGAGTQDYTVSVEARNLSPVITSVPTRYAPVGQAYAYQIGAFEPDSEPVTFFLGPGAPAGMTLDPATGLLQWSPASGDVGEHPVTLIARDPKQAEDRQTYVLDVTDAALALASPTGAFQVDVGQSLDLPVQANYPKAVLTVVPALANATLDGGVFRFTPSPEQEGQHALSFQASFAGMQVANVVTVTVTRPNEPPAFAPLGMQHVDEGGELSFKANATDADGDPVNLSAPGLSLPNAFFNELTGQFLFRPAFGQAGNHSVILHASDGRDTTQVSVPIAVAAVQPPPESLDLIVNDPASPTFATQQSITGSVRGEVGPAPPPSLPSLISALSPASMRQGQTVQVQIAGFNTDFQTGVTQADFGPGVAVQSFTVLSPTAAQATIQADPLAALGPHQVRLTNTGGAEVYSVVAFNVLPGAAAVTGTLIDPFTQLPLVNARVGLPGSSLFTTTGADGKFTLSGLPPGSVELVVTLPNYEVKKILVALGTNATVDLGDPIPLTALARPASPGGTLPRAATVASVLDRGVATRGGGMTLEQAKLLITDTMIAVGGEQAGVVDAAGNQLNPKIQGPGLLSLKPEGVEAHARAVVQGDVVTLGEVISALLIAFRYRTPISMDDVLRGFQRAADAAWADPGSPISAMAVVLFNDGPTLSAQPPVLTAGTPLNRFQVFLLVSSFIVHNMASLDASLDRILRADGYDPENLPLVGPLASAPALPATTAADSSLVARRSSLAEHAPHQESEADAGVMTALLNLIVPSAQAQQIIQTGTAQGNIFARHTFTSVYRNVRGNMIAEATQAASIAGIIAAGAALCAWTSGSILGVAGAIAAVSGVAAIAMVGFGQVLFEKMVFSWFIASLAASFTPEPANIRSAELDADGNLVIIVERSTTEVAQNSPPDPNAPPGTPRDPRHNGINPEFINYAYHLYRFNDCFEEDLDRGLWQNVPARLDETDPHNASDPPLGRLKFIVPKFKLERPGFFKVVTIQYLRKKGKDVVTGVDTYDQPGPAGTKDGVLSASEWEGAGRDPVDFAVRDNNNDGVVDDSEFSETAVRDDVGSKAFEDTGNRVIGESLKDAGVFSERQFKSSIDQKTIDFRTQSAVDLQQQAAVDRHLQQETLKKQMLLDFTNEGTKFYEQRFANAHANMRTYEQAVARASDLQDFSNVLGQSRLGGPTGLLDGNPQAANAFQQQFGRAPFAHEPALITDVAQASVARAEVTRQSALINGEYGRVRNFVVECARHPGTGTTPLSIDYNTIENGQVVQKNLTVNPADLNDPTARRNELARVFAAADAQKTTEVALNRQMSETFADYDVKVQNLVESNQQGFKQALANEGSVIRNGWADYAALADERAVLEKEIGVLDRRQRMNRTQLPVERPFYPPPRYLGAQFAADATSGVVTVTTNLAQLLQSVQVLASEFSACVQFGPSNIPLPTELFPPSLLNNPNVNELGAVLRSAVDPLNPKNGFATAEYPLDNPFIVNSSAGFPPDHLTTDDRGRIYAINRNSNLKFGGRIFRFDPIYPTRTVPNAPLSMELGGRELVGTVNYYSVLIQYGKPAYPVAMVTSAPFDAPLTGSSQTVKTQDLFVASADIVDNKTRILRVPISVMDTNPAPYAGGQNRDHIVGQTVIEDDRLELTGPSDMVIGPDPASALAETNDKGVLMLSDESTIWGVLNPLSSAPELVEVLTFAGRRWSGLAFDKAGSFYFADFSRGEIWVLKWSTVRDILLRVASPPQDNIDLSNVGFIVAQNLDRPGDIEVEEGSGATRGRTLLVSTFFGTDKLPLPIVGRFAAPGAIAEMKVRLKSKLGPVDSFFSTIFRAEFAFDDLETRGVTLLIRRSGSNTWEERFVTLSDFGVTIEDPFS
jgi:hypothetical protein